MEELIEKLDRDKESHKGENGRVGVIAGSRDYTGAPALAGRAALRTGCDLVKILTAEASRDVVASFSENLIVDSYSSDYFGSESLEKAERLEEWSDSLVIGPGLGDPEKGAVEKLLARIETPVVVDADAIESALEADFGDAVFTPHRGEKKSIEEKFGSVENFVKEKGVVTVVKGPLDRIYTPEGIKEIEAGTEAMTVGGTGDVMAGVIASLISQGLETGEAAEMGTWINGKAGEIATDRFGRGMVATDVVENITEAF